MIKRLFAIVLSFIVLVGCSKSPSPPSYDDTVNSTITSLREYWTIKLSLLPGGYVPIQIYSYDDPADLECGGDPAELNNAFFCSKSQIGEYMGFDTNFVRKRYDEFGPGWIYLLFSHEFAHSIQFRVDQRGSNTRFFELQADCLAGAYIAEMYHLGKLPLTQVEMDGITRVLYVLGDDAPGKTWPVSPEKAANGHGTGLERYTSFYTGYNGGIPACKLKDVG